MDYNSALPVRSEQDSNARLQTKLVDKTNPDTQQATVDTDSNLHVEIHGNDPAGVDRVVRTSEIGALTPDGVYNATTNTIPGNTGLIASVRDAAPSSTTQTQRLTSVTNSTKRLLDVAIHDESGAAFSNTNPLPVTIVDSEGLEYNNYNTVAAVAAAGTSNHDYTALVGIKLTKIQASSSGRAKFEVAVETASASGVFNTIAVFFNSTSNPNIDFTFNEAVPVLLGAKIRIIRTNRETLAAQDLYSLICAHDA